jgi:hypothetical protein
MPSAAEGIFLNLLDDYRAGRISILRLANGLQQIYWNIEFYSKVEEKKFFDAFFDIEQIAASYSEGLHELKPSQVEIVSRSVNILQKLAEERLHRSRMTGRQSDDRTDS